MRSVMRSDTRILERLGLTTDGSIAGLGHLHDIRIMQGLLKGYLFWLSSSSGGWLPYWLQSCIEESCMAHMVSAEQSRLCTSRHARMLLCILFMDEFDGVGKQRSSSGQESDGVCT